MATKEEIRAKLMQEKQQKQRGATGGSGGDNASYAFWNIPEGTSALARFLPDGDPDNTYFWVKREVIKLPFQGIINGENDTDREVSVTVPCVDMFGMTCPIIAETRPWWRDPNKEALARLYYKKKSYIFQGFVVQSPFEEQNVPENPIRRFVINPSIFGIIEDSLMDPEMDDLPTDFVGGRDFRITKTKKGDYANYSTSTWSLKTRSLSEAEHAAIAQYGLFDLKEYQGRRPDADEVEAIKAMFHASLAGEPYDMSEFGKYYRPYSNRDDDDAGGSSARTSYAAPKADSTPAASSASPAPAVSSSSSGSATTGKSSAQDILDRIKKRTAEKS